MLHEIVCVTTRDGLMLDGVLQRPATNAAAPLPVDAFLLVHGTGSNFYAPGVLERFAAQAVEHGAAALRINTRGHDGICSISSRAGPVRGGATHEVFSDSVHDLVAWIEFLRARGFVRIALVGHSSGGVKAIYTLAHEPQPAVRALIAITPPRFSHERFQRHALGAKFRADYARARELVEQGHPDALLSVTQPMPFLATAAGYLEKYGPDDRYDFVKHLPQVTCPVLVVLGSESVATSPAFDGLPESLAELATQMPHLQTELVAGANINFAACREAPFERAAAWLRVLK